MKKTTATDPDSPYVGLVPYSREDAERFRGRDAETEALISLTLGSRCLVVHGPSGVGKSSLLRAGVSATLDRINRAQSEAFGKPDFVVAYFHDWKDPDPLPSVNAAIAKAWGGIPIVSGGLRETVAAGVREKGTDLVLILDQFEEFFLYHPDAVARPDTAAGGWLSQIAGLMAPGGPGGENERAALLSVHLVITLREEALAKLDGLQRIFPALFKNIYRVAPLTSAQAREAVVAPLEWWNSKHPSEPPVTATQAFADQVTAEVRQGQVGFEHLSIARQSTTRAGDAVDAVEAPFLQLVLQTVWRESVQRWSNDPSSRRELNTAILEKLGGAPAIVNNHLIRTLEESTNHEDRPVFSSAELKLIARLSLHLVTIDLAKIAHSAASLSAFVDSPLGDIESILTRLESLRIIRRVPVPGSSGQDRFEIAHDMLGKAIVNWRPSYLKKVELARLKRESSERNNRIFLRAAVITLAVVTALAIYSWHLKAKAETAEALATEQSSLALRESAESKRLREIAEKDRESAVSSAKRDIQNQSKEESERRLALEGKLQEVTELIDRFLAGHPGFRSELEGASSRITESVNQLSDPRVASLKTGGPIRAARYSPDGKYIALGSEDKRLYLWSRSGGDPLARTTASVSPGGVSSLAFSPSQGFLLTGSAGSSIRLFDPRRSVLGDGLPVAQQNSVNLIRFSKTGKFSVSLDDDRLAELRDWSMYPKEVPSNPTAAWKHGSAVTFADFSDDESRVVTSSNDGMVRVFETSGKGDLLPVLVNGGKNNPLDVQAPTRKFRFSPTDKDLAVGGAGYSKLVWFHLGGNRGALYQDHTKSVAQRGPFIHGDRGAVWDVSFRPSGTHLASVGTDGQCLIWDTATEKTIASVLTEIGGRLLDVEWGDNDLLALGGEDGWIELWDLGDPASPKKVFAAKAHSCPVWAIQFDPLKEQILTYGRDLRPIEEAVTNPSGRASKWKAPPSFPSPDFTAAVWDIEAARRRGWSAHTGE